MNVKEFLDNKYKDTTKWFILDSIEPEPGTDSLHADIDYIYYSYNTKRYNKLNVGDIFLYRRPKKASKNRKFFFYGGGKISKIEKLDDEGRVRAHIKDAFKLVLPLYEDDERVLDVKWTFKQKKDTWEHFWGQYGMNLINKEDFFNLVGNEECVAASECSQVTNFNDFNSEKDIVNDELFDSSFIITISEDEVTKSNVTTKTRTFTPRKIDYNKLNKSRSNIGKLGELIVLKMEEEFLLNNGKSELSKQIKHISEEFGDGDGYDILSFDLNGTVKYIEVKTTTKKELDGFFITPNELEFASKHKENYFLYRVYNLDKEKCTADLKIYRGAITSELYTLTPIAYKITLK